MTEPGKWAIVILTGDDFHTAETMFEDDKTFAVRIAREAVEDGYTAYIAGPLRTVEPDIGEAWDDTSGGGG